MLHIVWDTDLPIYDPVTSRGGGGGGGGVGGSNSSSNSSSRISRVVFWNVFAENWYFYLSISKLFS